MQFWWVFNEIAQDILANGPQTTEDLYVRHTTNMGLLDFIDEMFNARVIVNNLSFNQKLTVPVSVSRQAFEYKGGKWYWVGYEYKTWCGVFKEVTANP